METVPTDVDVTLVRDQLGTIEGVEGVHHVHAWGLASGKNLFSAHIQVQEDVTHDRVLTEAREILRTKFRFYFSTLQVERHCIDPGQASDIDFADEPPPGGA